jgi:hypothetical protein
MATFRQALPKDNVSVTFDTNYRTAGTVSMPIFTLNESLKRVGKINVERVVFPCSYFVFHTGNNTLGGFGVDSITLNPGTYTQSSLASAIQAAIRGLGGGFTATLCSVESNIFTISTENVTTFSINAAGALATILGFSSNKNSVTEASSDFPVYENTIVIVSSNRTFVINQSSTDYTFNITPGNYNGNTLATEIQTQILLQLSNFGVTYNSNNYTFVFTANAAFTVKSTGSASNALGFVNNISSTSNVVNSQQPVNIIGPTSVIIKSRSLTNDRQMIVRSSSVYGDSIYELLLNGSAGDIIYDEPKNPTTLFMASSGGATISSVDFRICDDTGSLMNLGPNGRWKIYLTFEIY